MQAANALRAAADAGLNTYSLPVEFADHDGESALELAPEAEAMLDYFRGVGPLPPPDDHDDRRRRPAPAIEPTPSPTLRPRMKALILAGGAGTRLRPITHTRAKQLVPVANKPILFYGIEAMVAAGITEIGVIIGDTGPEVREALGDGSRFGATITYLPQDAPLGLAHCVLIARDFLGDDDFVMYLGDNLLEQDLGRVRRRVRGGPGRPPTRRRRRSCSSGSPTRTASASPRSTPTATSSSSSRSPTDPPSDLALVGVYLFDPTIHEAVRGHRAVRRGRARDHRRHPVADRPTATACAPSCSPAGGSTPAS